MVPFSVTGLPDNSPPSYRNLPDVHAILACVEHTVSTGSKGFNHNRHHAYAKLNGLLKCPLNLGFIVLGVHGDEMAIWYGDRSGAIEVEFGAHLVGLANLPFKRDPCVDFYQIHPTRAYKITLHEESTTDYTERTFPFCTSQMGLTAEEPSYLQASERVPSSRLITSLPSMQLQTQIGSLSNSHIHPSHGMSNSRSMDALSPPNELLNGKRCKSCRHFPSLIHPGLSPTTNIQSLQDKFVRLLVLAATGIEFARFL